MKSTDQRFSELCKELRKYYESNPGAEDVIITLPEIFGRQHRETFISAWLGYLLDPARSGFGASPLQALLSVISDDYLINEDEPIEVQTEYAFEDGRIIDFLIATDSYLIGLENKLWSSEQANQTRDYWKNLNELEEARDREVIAIFLVPESNTATSYAKFHRITYDKLCQAFQAIPYNHRRDTRKNFYFYEFILYVEEVLMEATSTGFPVVEDDLKIYMEHKKEIDAVLQQYRKYTDSFNEWLVQETEKQYKKRAPDLAVKIAKPKSRYWQIFESTAWEQLNFHFELLWGEGTNLSSITADDKDVVLVAHLERARDSVKKHFADANVDVTKTTLLKKAIEVDFHTETDSRDTINRIIELLRSKEFQELAQIANDCVAKLSK